MERVILGAALILLELATDEGRTLQVASMALPPHAFRRENKGLAEFGMMLLRCHIAVMRVITGQSVCYKCRAVL